MIESGNLRIVERTAPSAAGEILIAKLQGKLTLGKESVLLRDHIRTKLDGGTRHLLLELENVSYIDSAGIAVLVELKAHAIHVGGDLCLCRCPSAVTRILYRLALRRILEVYETEEQAIEAWASGGPVGATKSRESET